MSKEPVIQHYFLNDLGAERAKMLAGVFDELYQHTGIVFEKVDTVFEAFFVFQAVEDGVERGDPNTFQANYETDANGVKTIQDWYFTFPAKVDISADREWAYSAIRKALGLLAPGPGLREVLGGTPGLTKSEHDPLMWETWAETKEGRLDGRNQGNYFHVDDVARVFMTAEQQKGGGIASNMGTELIDLVEKKYNCWLNDCRLKTLNAANIDTTGDDPAAVVWRATRGIIRTADSAYYKLLEEWLHLVTGLIPNMDALIKNVYYDRSHPDPDHTIAGLPGYRVGNSPDIYLEVIRYKPTQDQYTVKG